MKNTKQIFTVFTSLLTLTLVTQGFLMGNHLQKMQASPLTLEELQRRAAEFRRHRARQNQQQIGNYNNNQALCAQYRAQYSAWEAQQRYQNQTSGELGAITGGEWVTVDSSTGLNVPSYPPIPPAGCR